MIEDIRAIRDASWEQLDSIASVEGEKVRLFTLSLIYMKQIVDGQSNLISMAKEAGMTEEEFDAHANALSHILTSLTIAIGIGFELKEEQMESGFRWMENLLTGAERRLTEVFNRE